MGPSGDQMGPKWNQVGPNADQMGPSGDQMAPSRTKRDEVGTNSKHVDFLLVSKGFLEHQTQKC